MVTKASESRLEWMFQIGSNLQRMVPSRGKILPIRPISRGKIDSVDVIALPRIDTKACDIYSGQRFEMPRYINIIIEHYI